LDAEVGMQQRKALVDVVVCVGNDALLVVYGTLVVNPDNFVDNLLFTLFLHFFVHFFLWITVDNFNIHPQFSTNKGSREPFTVPGTLI
jgi:arginine exporter protein ArgO